MLSQINEIQHQDTYIQEKIHNNRQGSKGTPYVLQEIYTKSEVLHLFQKLSNRIDDLEHTVSMLKKQNVMQNNIPTKKEILAHLNDYNNGAVPAVDFNNMINHIQNDIKIPYEMLEDRTLKLDNLIISMLEALHSHIATEHTHDEHTTTILPIVNFQDYHKNVMFVYTDCITIESNNENTMGEPTKNTTQWTILTNEHTQKVIQHVHISLIKQCNQWREKFLEQSIIKYSSHNKEILSNKYTNMIARICNTSPHTNHSMLQKIKKTWAEFLSTNNTVRLII